MKLYGCVGGAIELEEPFAAFVDRHCSRCREKTGSAHAENALVPSAQFAWRCGAELVGKYELEGTRWSSAFGSGHGWSAHFLVHPPHCFGQFGHFSLRAG
jgi:hypothetical protein